MKISLVLMAVLGMALAQNCVPQHIFYSMASEEEIKIGVYWETLDDCPQEISYTTPDGKTLSQKPGLLSSRDKKYIHYSTFHTQKGITKFKVGSVRAWSTEFTFTWDDDETKPATVFIISNLRVGDRTSIDLVTKMASRMMKTIGSKILVDLGNSENLDLRYSVSYYELLKPLLENLPYQSLPSLNLLSPIAIPYKVVMPGLLVLFPLVDKISSGSISTAETFLSSINDPYSLKLVFQYESMLTNPDKSLKDLYSTLI